MCDKPHDPIVDPRFNFNYEISVVSVVHVTTWL